MILFICFLTFLATSAGAVAGLGGGIIIKPLMDIFDVCTLEETNLLSGLTVLCMSAVSIAVSLRAHKKVDVSNMVLITIGSIMGGVAGKQLFSGFLRILGDDELAGVIQSLILFSVTLMIFMHSFCGDRRKSYKVRHQGTIVITGFLLGLFSTFMGIGGGPLNMIVLTILFSTDLKSAALYSIYIIFFSQATSLTASILSGGLTHPDHLLMLGMCLSGIGGGLAGGFLSLRLPEKYVGLLYRCLLIVILIIIAYNIFM